MHPDIVRGGAVPRFEQAEPNHCPVDSACDGGARRGWHTMTPAQLPVEMGLDAHDGPQ